jgi:hypothetical protein
MRPEMAGMRPCYGVSAFPSQWRRYERGQDGEKGRRAAPRRLAPRLVEIAPRLAPHYVASPLAHMARPVACPLSSPLARCASPLAPHWLRLARAP